MKYMKKKWNLFRIFQKKAAFLTGIGYCGVLVFAYITLVYAIPGRIFISENTTDIRLPLPVVFEEKEPDAAETAENIRSYQDGTREDVTIQSQEKVYSCKLFGVIPVKEVTAQVTEEQTVLAGGIPVGIYVQTDGVLVIGTGNVTNRNKEMVSPSENLVKSGDYILEVNGRPVQKKEELVKAVKECGGDKVILKIQRDGSLIEVAIHPVESERGAYKIGLWVRDDLAGIGTLTYVTKEKEYGALGHAVSDADTGSMLSIKSGTLYESNIVGIVKGQSGTPGELNGVIDYGKKACMGEINRNTPVGIYGTVTQLPEQAGAFAEYPVGYKQEIEPGEAQIISSVDNTPTVYQIRITEVDYHEDEEYKQIMFEVTDERLLELTGGVVQGMSGSPIIQNGRLIGAVTHVFVQDATKGYGVFLETMLEHN